MSDPVIRVEGLGKEYRLGQYQGYQTLRESIVRAFSRLWGRTERVSGETVWALRDATFEVAPGEVVGVIGRNGAGKTTLLKILSRITEPTTGQARIVGRVGSLLEVGTGFNPELSGRENIFLNGAILGMRRSEIEAQFDQIVEFAEIGRFLDTPVKRYSSGMYIRLAFAVAAHLEPEILIVDEVLAVGDFKFQEKCLDKMKDVTRVGRTVLFVSHNMKAIAEICSRVLLVEDGRITRDGAPQDVIRHYLGGDDENAAEKTWAMDDAPGNDVVRLLGVRASDEAETTKSVFAYTEPIRLVVTFEVLDDTPDFYLRLYIENEDGVCVLVTTDTENTRYEKGVHRAEFQIAPHTLNEGKFYVQQVLFKVGLITSGEDVARADYPVNFEVDYSGKFTGGVRVKHPGVIRPDWSWQVRAHGD